MANVPSYTSDFFKTAHRLIDQVLDTATKGKLAEYSGIAVDLVQAGVVIWMIIYAFQTIAGKQKTPVADFLWQMGKMALILIFVKNTGGWMDAANNEINALKTTLAGGLDPWVWLDQLWVKTSQVGALLMQLDTSDYVKVEGALGSWATYIGSIIALMTASIIFFSAEITLKLLTITAPLFVMCLIFGFLRQMFNNWLQLIFSSLLTLMFATLALRAGTSYLNHVLSVLVQEAKDSNLIAMGFMAMAAGIFTAFVAWKAAQFASQIASVGVEGSMQGAAALGLGAAGFAAKRALSGMTRRVSNTANRVGTQNREKLWNNATNSAQNASNPNPSQSIGQRVAEAARKRYGS